MKSSNEYLELYGLQLYLDHIQMNRNIPPEVEKWIQLRINYLKNK